VQEYKNFILFHFILFQILLPCAFSRCFSVKITAKAIFKTTKWC